MPAARDRYAARLAFQTMSVLISLPIPNGRVLLCSLGRTQARAAVLDGLGRRLLWPGRACMPGGVGVVEVALGRILGSPIKASPGPVRLAPAGHHSRPGATAGHTCRRGRPARRGPGGGSGAQATILPLTRAGTAGPPGPQITG
jgi:hypothetical protein